jgi:hypothetical protein
MKGKLGWRTVILLGEGIQGIIAYENSYKVHGA